MTNGPKNYFCIGVIIFTCFAVLLTFGCASSRSEKFQRKIRRMPSNELISYYQGINERIKDIDNDIKRNDRQEQTRRDDANTNMTFFFGGQGYDLIQKRKAIKKELNKRRLTP